MYKDIDKVKNALLSMQRLPWEQGVAAQAFLELGDREMVILMAKEAVLRQSDDGRLGLIQDYDYVTDSAANGEAVFYSAKLTGDQKLKEASDKMVSYLLEKAPQNKDGTLYHLISKKQIWVDSMYMVPPFLSVAGYYKEAVNQITGFRKALWNPKKKLFSHVWDDDINNFAPKDLWGVGNGWAAAGMTRIIRTLPINMTEEKKMLAGFVKELLDGCLAFKRDDCLFHNVIDNPATFVETNLAQMIAYTIFRGIAGKWLEQYYLPFAQNMQQAAYKKVDKFGLVQGVCGAPHFSRPGTAPEGQAFFLLMEAAAKEL